MSTTLRRVRPPISDDYAQISLWLYERWQLLNHQADTLVAKAMVGRYGQERAAEMAWIHSAANPYPTLLSQAAALYHDAPRVSGPDAGVIAAVARAGHWGSMQRIQRDCNGVREIAVLVEKDEEEGLTLRAVYPHDFDAPRPRRARPREIGAIGLWLEVGDADWMLVEYQLEDADGTPHAVERRTLHDAVSGARTVVYLADEEGGAGDPAEPEAPMPARYAHRRPDGTPYIPVVLYHAAAAPTLLDWQAGADVATGAICVIMDATAVEHAFDHASYRQHYVVDAEPVGLRTDPNTGQQYATADPGKILIFRSVADANGRPMFGSFEAPVDVESLQRVVRTSVRDLAMAMGIPQQDTTRTSAEVKSAASLVVTAAQRAELQRQQKPVYMPCDQQLLTLVGWVLGVDSEPDEWKIEYPAVQLSPAEMLERQAVVKAGRENGTMTRLDAILYLHPHLTEAEAREKLAAIKAEEAAEPKPPANPPTPGVTP